MKRLAAFLFPVLLLVGCANIKTAYDTIVSAKVSPTLVVVAVNGFDAVKTTAKNYIVYCTPNPAPKGCDDDVIQNKIDPAIKSGTTARNTLKQFLKDHPGELGDRGVYDALVAATDTIKAAIINFKG